jgi:hypothetical protein
MNIYEIMQQAADQISQLSDRVSNLINQLKTDWINDFHQVRQRIRVPHGLDADKEASPLTGAMYEATDTGITYVCYEDGTWTVVGGSGQRTILIPVDGILAAIANATYEIIVPYDMEIVEVFVNVKTAPTGADLIIDVNLDGTTIFTTQGNRPTITATNKTGYSPAPDVVALPKNSAVSVDLDQVGSTIAGADLVVEIRCAS